MSHKSIPDVISLLIKIPDTKQYLFKIGHNQNISLPSTTINGSSWRETSNDFVKQILSINPTNINICRIYRLYCPYQDFVMNVIYEVTLLSEILPKCSINGMQWMSHTDAIKNVWMSHKYWKCLFVPKNERESFVHEITMKETLVTDSNTDPQHYEMVCVAGVTEEDQKYLYREFIQLIWPENLMLMNEFKTFCNIIFKGKEDQKFIERLFNAADVNNRKCLSFRDVLYVLAASSRDTPHNGSCLDIRIRYIFKYFDQEAKGYWDDDDLKSMMQEMSDRRGKKLTEVDLAKEVVIARKQILRLPGPKILLQDVLSAVNELRFRGTSTLLRFKHKLKIRQSLDKASDIVSRFSQSRNVKQTETVEIAVHTLKFRNMGTMIDVDELWAMNTIVSPSSIKPLKNLKVQDRSSSLLFQQNTAVNEILRSLKYFSQEVASSDTSKQSAKQAYSWGKTSMIKFGTSFITICEKLTKRMKDDPRCLEIQSPMYVMGDLHGNFQDLIAFERILWHLSPALTPCNLLFLGDYVDRGANSVEILAYLFAYKYQNYNKVHLIRGNHEIRDIQRMFSFYAECMHKFGNNLGNKVWNAVNNVFDVMPLAAVIDTKIFACHGGIPPPWLLPGTYEMINDVPCPLPLPNEQSQLAWSLLWNDPVKDSTNIDVSVKEELEQNNGFARNVRRGTAYVFDETALIHFLHKNNFTHVIRAHEVQPHGVSIQFSGKLLSVFSSSNYCGMNNDAACLAIDSNKIRLLRMDVETFAAMKKIDGEQ